MMMMRNFLAWLLMMMMKISQKQRGKSLEGFDGRRKRKVLKEMEELKLRVEEEREENGAKSVRT